MINNALNHSDKSQLSLVMPVLDEGARVIPVIATLAYTVKVPLELIAVYDSDDSSTKKVIEDLKIYFPNVKLVRNHGTGVIKAIQSGFGNCESDIVGIWTPYHVDPFGVVNEMYDLVAGGYDLVSGNRFNKVKRFSRGNPIKKLLSRTGNYLLNRLIGIPLGDITTNAKLYRKKVLREIPIETKRSGGWAMVTELAVKSAIKGYRITEIEFLPQNVNMIHGISNFKVFKHLDQYVKWLWYGFKNRKVIKKNYEK
jgi:dolichol-phosphate mannosyltransferase